MDRSLHKMHVTSCVDVGGNGAVPKGKMRDVDFPQLCTDFRTSGRGQPVSNGCSMMHRVAFIPRNFFPPRLLTERLIKPCPTQDLSSPQHRRSQTHSKRGNSSPPPAQTTTCTAAGRFVIQQSQETKNRQTNTTSCPSLCTSARNCTLLKTANHDSNGHSPRRRPVPRPCTNGAHGRVVFGGWASLRVDRAA